MKVTLSFILLSLIALTNESLIAQTISGFSTIVQTFKCSVVPPVSGCPANRLVPEIYAYTETSEDYTASLYYNVTSDAAIFSGGSRTASSSGSYTSNPNVNLVFSQTNFQSPNVLDGIWTAATDHYVDFYYISSVGEYYDPYGYSQYVQNTGDGDYNSGYWFSVYANIYVAEASVLLGQSYDSTNSQPHQYQGPAVESVLYQSYIAPDWVTGPPAANCASVIYAGDNRKNNPALGSYRNMQNISVGVGGLTSINPGNAPPIQATGFTFQFASSVLQNNTIPNSAYNIDYLTKCSPNGINAFDQASTSGFQSPTVRYVTSNDTQVSLGGTSNNPVPALSLPIYWASSIDLTETTPANLYVGGYLRGTCYPHHELSVGLTDIASWQPAFENSLPYLAFCLAGGDDFQINIQSNIPLVRVPGLL